MSSRRPVEDRRQELVAAAFSVIARDGIAATTTRAICAEAGVAQSVFYYCFNAKRELFEELTRTALADQVGPAAPAADFHDDFKASLRAGLLKVWEQTLIHPERQLVLYELATYLLRDPEFSDLAQWMFQQYYETAQEFADAHADAAGVDWTVPMPVLRRLIATAVDGLVFGWLADRNDAEAEATLMAFADLFAGLARPRVAA